MSRTRRALVVCFSIILGLAVGACAEAPAPEPDSLSGATRQDTIIRLEEQTYGQAITTVYRDTLPACQSCEVRLVPVGSFGRSDDEILLIDLHVRVERDSQGRFYASSVGWTPPGIIVYEPDGSIVRTVGRQGEGPGEFRHAVRDLLIGPGDSLFVVDVGMRLNVFDSTGAPVDTRLLDPGGGIATMRLVDASHDEVVLSYAPPHSMNESRLHPLHAFDREGRLLHSFGPVGVGPLRDAHLSPERPIRTMGPLGTSMAPDEAIWIWSGSNYRLERIGQDSAVDRVIGVTNPESWHGQLRMSYLDDAGVILREGLVVDGFHQIDENLGVAVLSVASSDWEDVELRPHPRFPADRRASDVHQELRDSVIDIIHLPTGEVLARRRLPLPSYFTSDGTLYSVMVNELGVIQIQAFEIELSGFEGSVR